MDLKTLIERFKQIAYKRYSSRADTAEDIFVDETTSCILETLLPYLKNEKNSNNRGKTYKGDHIYPINEHNEKIFIRLNELIKAECAVANERKKLIASLQKEISNVNEKK